MVRQTIMLFIKATIIGILINAGLAQLPSASAPTNDNFRPAGQTLMIEQPANQHELSAN